jgi:phosphatidylglycerophosphatase A
MTPNTFINGESRVVRLVALAVATVGGVGLVPYAPGTAGSLVAAVFAWMFERGRLWGTLIMLCFIAWPAIHVSLKHPISQKHASRLSQRKQLVDPSYIVIDEVIGQLLCLHIVQIFFDLNFWIITVAFVLFRFFDIFKPWPIRNIERSLENRTVFLAISVVLDDVLAGLFAGLGSIAILKCIRL